MIIIRIILAIDNQSHGINGLKTDLLALHRHLSNSLASQAQTSPNQRELLLGVDLGVELLLEISHAEHRVPVAHIDMILLYLWQFVENATEEGGHLLVEFLHFELHDILVGVLDDFADGLLVIVHTLDHLIMLILLLLVVTLA